MPWYGESLPASWIQLVAELEKRRVSADGSRVYSLSWDEYREVALSPPCSIPPEFLASATMFLHDSCVIRYFGHLDLDASGAHRQDLNSPDPDTSQSMYQRHG